MTAIQLRNTIVEKIHLIKDTEFLKALNVIIDNSQIHRQAYQLNDSQKESIQNSRNEIQKGEIITHKDVLKKQTKWLKK